MNESAQRVLGYLSPLFLVVIGFTEIALNLPISSNQPLKFTMPTLDCRESPQFVPGYQSDIGAIRQQPDGRIFMMYESWLQADICRPVTLLIEAEGQAAGGADPQLTVALSGQILLERSIHQRQTIRLSVHEAGRVTLAFLNDFYRSDARIASVIALRQIGAGCTPDVVVPPATGGTYNAQTGSANLVSSVPMTVIPCRAGSLSFQIVGRSGGKKYPTVAVMQGGVLLKNILTTGSQQYVTVSVSTQPVTITLIDPYFRELEDRNLIIHKIEVIPTGSP